MIFKIIKNFPYRGLPNVFTGIPQFSSVICPICETVRYKMNIVQWRPYLKIDDDYPVIVMTNVTSLKEEYVSTLPFTLLCSDIKEGVAFRIFILPEESEVKFIRFKMTPDEELWERPINTLSVYRNDKYSYVTFLQNIKSGRDLEINFDIDIVSISEPHKKCLEKGRRFTVACKEMWEFENGIYLYNYKFGLGYHSFEKIAEKVKISEEEIRKWFQKINERLEKLQVIIFEGHYGNGIQIERKE